MILLCSWRESWILDPSNRFSSHCSGLGSDRPITERTFPTPHQRPSSRGEILRLIFVKDVQKNVLDVEDEGRCCFGLDGVKCCCFVVQFRIWDIALVECMRWNFFRDEMKVYIIYRVAHCLRRFWIPYHFLIFRICNLELSRFLWMDHFIKYWRIVIKTCYNMANVLRRLIEWFVEFLVFLYHLVSPPSKII